MSNMILKVKAKIDIEKDVKCGTIGKIDRIHEDSYDITFDNGVKYNVAKDTVEIAYQDIAKSLLDAMEKDITIQFMNIIKQLSLENELKDLNLQQIEELKSSIQFDSEDIEKLTKFLKEKFKNKSIDDIIWILEDERVVDFIDNLIREKIIDLSKKIKMTKPASEEAVQKQSSVWLKKSANPVEELKRILKKIHPDLSENQLDDMVGKMLEKSVASSEYNDFVKKYFEEHPDAKPGDPKVMEEISKLWKEKKKEAKDLDDVYQGIVFQIAQKLAKTFPSSIRWVYGTKTGKWYFVDENDRDYIYGLTNEEILNMTEEEAIEKYLRPQRLSNEKKEANTSVKEIVNSIVEEETPEIINKLKEAGISIEQEEKFKDIIQDSIKSALIKFKIDYKNLLIEKG